MIDIFIQKRKDALQEALKYAYEIYFEESEDEIELPDEICYMALGKITVKDESVVVQYTVTKGAYDYDDISVETALGKDIMPRMMQDLEKELASIYDEYDAWADEELGR